LRWFRRRALSGLGSATFKALRDLDAGNHWALSGARGERAAGNGAAMRIAPLAFLLDPHDRAHRVVIRDVCSITHHSDEAYIGALAVLVALSLLAPTAPEALLRVSGSLPDSQVRERLQTFAALPTDMPLGRIAERFGSSGYVVETVPLALLAAFRSTSANFEAILGELVESGGDTDTIGAIAGQLAGARLGLSGLPAHLVDLPEIQAVPPLADVFAREVVGRA
jgi:ADP-ribosylglycohydrolase